VLFLCFATMPGMQDAAFHDEDFSIDCLLQELLLALVGYTGDVFVDTSTEGCAAADVWLARCWMHAAACKLLIRFQYESS
jgi:hypothetical protein